MISLQVEITRAEYEEAHRKATERDRTMTVCDVCGVFMTSTDSEARREVRRSWHNSQGRHHALLLLEALAAAGTRKPS